MPEFTCAGLVRQGFGFYNPNHAAAFLCALFPFCFGWRGAWRRAGWLAAAALVAMLAMTYSRTGLLVLAGEAVSLWFIARWREFGRDKYGPPAVTPTPKHSPAQTRLIVVFCGIVCLSLAIWWMWPRLALDGAITNRPKIWLAGLRLAAANPWGVGLGHSGEMASAFMLPREITVRTLVNSHLTLLAEFGWIVGGAWVAFIVAAVACGGRMPRARIAFAGLAASAFASSVFDWHVLFDFAGFGGLGAVNYALAWAMLLLFVGLGVAMIWKFTHRRRGSERAEASGKMGAASAVVAMCALCVATLALRSDATPRVEGDYVAVGLGEARVFRDVEWSFRAVAARFPDGARYCLKPGVPAEVVDGGEVWLFGDVAESAWRFPSARLMLVSPPEFCSIPPIAIIVR